MEEKEEEEEKYYLKKMLENPAMVINKDIYLYLFNLMKFIFFKENATKKNFKEFKEHLINETKYINEKIINYQCRKFFKDKYNDEGELIEKIKEKYIIVEREDIYSIKNFKNILDFVKFQNRRYSGDIIECTLIYLFSKVFKTDKTRTFGKYIFNNISRLKDPKNYEIINWFTDNIKMFRDENFDDLKNLLTKDACIDDNEFSSQDVIDFQSTSPFFNLLVEISKNKYISLSDEYKNNKTILYLNNGEFKCQELSDKMYELSQENGYLDRDTTQNSISKLFECFFYSSFLGKERKIPINLMRALFISVYIYYQNKNSPLMKYIPPINKENKEENEKGLKYIEFSYDLKSACVEGRFANIIISPLRIEPRISKVILSQNNLREAGLQEISKLLLFNKHINQLDCNISVLKTNYLDYFNFGLGLFDNKTIKELNISYNYLKEDCGNYLAKFISHLKGLKTLCINSNDLKGGAGELFIVLKNLYRKNKIELENLYMNKCILDNTSYYELAELLQSKYCKLKRLYLSMNKKPTNFDFLKKLKKNRCLIEINFNKNNYDNSDIDNINRIINLTNLKHLYICKNSITNFNNCLRIMYRTKLINDSKVEQNEINNRLIQDQKEEQKIEKEIEIIKMRNEKINFDENGVLLNLDISNNEAFILNKNQINLIYKFINQNTLGCLDISHILLGPNPGKSNINVSDFYKKSVDNLKNTLEKYKDKYNIAIGERKTNKVDIKHLKELKNDEIIKAIDKVFNKDINKMLEDKNALYPTYLKECAYKIIKIIDDNKIKYKDIKEIILKKKNEKSDRKSSLKQLINKIADYLLLRRAERDLDNINKELNKKKLIII